MKRPAACLEEEPAVPKLELMYFNIAAKGEPIRLLCAHAGVPLVDTRLSFEEFGAKKQSGELHFGQVPALVVNGKKQLVQTAAILRYLARLKPSSCLYPSDPEEAAVVDALVDQVGDAFMSMSMYKYGPRFGLSDEIMTDDNKAAFFKEIETKILPAQLGFVSNFLEKSSSGWLANTKEPTIADFYWVCQLRMLTEWFKLDEPLKDFPHLQKLVSKLNGLPAVEAYYKKNGS